MTPQEYFEAELQRLEEQWQAGRLDALMNAIELCSGQWPLPEWASLGAVNALRLGALGYPVMPVERGRSGGVIPRILQDDIHRTRWNMARWALGETRETATAVERKRVRREIALVYGREKGTRPEAFEIASELLQGKPAQGSPSAVEESYKLVKTSVRNGSSARFRVENSGN